MPKGNDYVVTIELEGGSADAASYAELSEQMSRLWFRREAPGKNNESILLPRTTFYSDGSNGKGEKGEPEPKCDQLWETLLMRAGQAVQRVWRGRYRVFIAQTSNWNQTVVFLEETSGCNIAHSYLTRHGHESSTK